MPRDLSELTVGEQWAYRAKRTEPLACVEVMRLGTGRPQRVQIKFVNDEFEGREEWVPPVRLKVPWVDADSWRENEKRWEDLRDANGYIRDTPEGHAIWMVIEGLRDWDLATALYNGNSSGIFVVHDVDAIVADLGIDRESLTSDPVSFVNDDGDLVIPWRVSRLVVEALARKHADTLLPMVEWKEKEAIRENQYGYATQHGTYISPEICASTDEDYRPARDLVRQWCGAEAEERYDELAALRVEVVRLGKLVERAISAVRSAGDVGQADVLERELGIPLVALRNAPGPD